jgi:hypothetical protein
MASSRKGEVDSDFLFRVFRWIPRLISDPPDLYRLAFPAMRAILLCEGNNGPNPAAFSVATIARFLVC